MDLYTGVLIVHVLAMIAWMAGLFYLPRLYVYHADVEEGSQAAELFKVMEVRLLRYIMNPALIVTWIGGLTLIVLNPAWLSEGWLHAKLLCVVLMTGAHGMMAKMRKTFAADANTKSSRYYRIFNEVPTVLLIIIVTMVIWKPF